MRKMLLVAFIFSILLFSNSIKGQTKSLKQQVWEYICCSNVKYPDIVFAQAMLESGEMTSKVFLKCQNLFGMKYPGRRKTVAIGKTSSGYAVYNHWYSSIEDYVLFQEYLFRNKTYTKSEYLIYLSMSYCKDKRYKQKVKRIIVQHQTMIDSTVL